MSIFPVNQAAPPAFTSPAVGYLRKRLFPFASPFAKSPGMGWRVERWRMSASDPNTFPQSAITGSLGDLARVLSAHTEVSEEFIFASALTVFGLMCAPDLRLKIGIDAPTRLYTVLIGTSYEAKKSTAMKAVLKFFEPLFKERNLHQEAGVGSDAGLARILKTHNKILLTFDEFRTLLDKAGIRNSTLLGMASSLYEQEKWGNAIKDSALSVSITNALLGMIGCCTTATYADIWTPEAISIGFPNRLFLVHADAKPRVAWPAKPNPFEIRVIQERILKQLNRLSCEFDIESEARRVWEDWYCALPRNSEHTKRLDTLGFRLMPIMALMTDKEIIDTETVEAVIDILDYELRIRMLYDPIDAATVVAKLEERIRRVLSAKGTLSRRELQQHCHANRHGLWAFEQAIKNLIANRELIPVEGGYRLLDRGA